MRGIWKALQALADADILIGLISNSHRCLESFQEHFELDGLIDVDGLNSAVRGLALAQARLADAQNSARLNVAQQYLAAVLAFAMFGQATEDPVHFVRLVGQLLPPLLRCGEQLARGGVERIGSESSPCFVEIGGKRQELKARVQAVLGRR